MDSREKYQLLWGAMLEVVRADADLDETQFDTLALRIFELQYRLNSTFRAYCDAMDRSHPAGWMEIPALPAAAFKRAKVTSFPPDRASTYFQTSGTSEGETGRHWFESTELYEAALYPTFMKYVMGDAERLPMHMIITSPIEAPHSSLVHMMQTMSMRLPGVGNEDIHYYVRNGNVDFSRFSLNMESVCAGGRPILLMGTAFGLVRVLDQMHKDRREFPLPTGSRIMETGGFKGRVRELQRAQFYAELEKAFRVPQHMIINEYGMTELSSQFYDVSLVQRKATTHKTGSAWARVRVVDPLTGTPLPHGEPGLIKIWDLANLGSVAVLQTEDVGVTHPEETFEVFGRVANAQPRGCSLSLDQS